MVPECSVFVVTEDGTASLQLPAGAKASVPKKQKPPTVIRPTAPEKPGIPDVKWNLYVSHFCICLVQPNNMAKN